MTDETTTEPTGKLSFCRWLDKQIKDEEKSRDDYHTAAELLRELDVGKMINKHPDKALTETVAMDIDVIGDEENRHFTTLNSVYDLLRCAEEIPTIIINIE